MLGCLWQTENRDLSLEKVVSLAWGGDAVVPSRALQRGSQVARRAEHVAWRPAGGGWLCGTSQAPCGMGGGGWSP